jgi:fibronectin-binding autotransporter adhesin
VEDLKNLRRGHTGRNRTVCCALRRKRLLLTSAVAAMACGQFAHAATTVTWNNTGTSYNNASDWNVGAPGTGSIALFNSAEVTDPNISTSLTNGTLDFAVGASGYDITATGGAILTLTGSNPIVAANTSGTNTLDTSTTVMLGNVGSSGIGQAAGGTLALNGVLAGGSSVTSVTFTGPGTFDIDGTNTYGNSATTTTLASGTFYLGNTAAFSSSTVAAGMVTISPSVDLTGANKLLNNFSFTSTTTFTGSSFGVEIGGTVTDNGSRVVTNNLSGGNSLTLSGGVVLPNNQQITFNGSGNTVIDSAITNGTATTTGALLTYNGTGTLTLSGTNTFSGGMTLSGGTVDLASTTALGAGTLNITGAADLDNTSGAPETLTNSNPITLNANFSFSSPAGTSNNSLNLGNGPVAMPSSRTITLNGSGNLTLGGLLTMSGGLTLSTTDGSSNAGTFGTLYLAGGVNLGGVDTAVKTEIFNGNGTVDITGPITDGTFPGSLTYSGTGLLNLSSPSNSYTGLTTISTGTLQLGVANGIPSGNNLTLAAAGTFDLAGNAQTIGLLSNAGSVFNSSSTAAALTIGPGSAGAGSFSGPMSVTWNQGATTTSFTGATGFINTGNLTLNANGAGAISITSANNAGLITNSGTGAGVATITTAGSNVTAITQASSTSNFTVSTLNAGGTGITQTLTSTGAASFTVGNVTGTGSIILDNNAGGTFTVSAANNAGVITNSGSGTNLLNVGTLASTLTGVVENSAGSTLVLTTTNAGFTGGITIKNGTVEGLNGNAFGPAGDTVTLGDVSGSNSATLAFGVGASGWNAPIVLGGTSGLLTISLAGSGTFNGGVTGSNSFTVVNNDNTTNGFTFTAPTNNAGGITVGGSGTGTAGAIFSSIGSNVTSITDNQNATPLTIGAGSITVNSGGTTFTTNSTGSLMTVSGAVGGTGDATFTSNNAGNLNVSAAITTTGNLFTNANGAGTIAITSANNTGPITNAGSGSGTVTISSIGSNVTTVTENSAASNLVFGGGANGNQSLLVLQGSVIGGGSSLTFGAGPITLGTASSSDNAALITTSSKVYANPISIASGDSGVIQLEGNSGNPTYSGGITFGASASTLTLAYSGTAIATISTGSVTGTGNLVVSSAGGTSYVTISAPSINMVGSITNNGTGTGSTIFSGPIGSNVTAVTESGTSPLTLGGSNSFSGGVLVSAGQLNVNNAYALSSGPLVIDGGSLGITSASVTEAPVIAQTWNSDFVFNPSATSTTLNMGSGAVNLGTTTFGTPAVAGARTVTFNDAGTLLLGGIVSNGSGAASGVTTLIKAGNGTLEFTNTGNTFSNLTVNSGVAAAVVAPTVTTSSYTNIISGGTPLGQGAITLDGGGIAFYGYALNAGNTATFVSLNNAISLAGNGSVILDNNPKRYGVLSGQITGAGQLTLTVNNAGGNAGVVLNNASNSYTGGTNLDNPQGFTGSNVYNSVFYATATGALGSGSLGAGGVVTFVNNSNVVSQSGSELVLAASQAIGGLSSSTASSNGLGLDEITGYSAVAANQVTLTISSAAGSPGDGASYSGTIGGVSIFGGPVLTQNGGTGYGTAAEGNNLALVKSGSGTQVLSGNNTFSGPTTISGGTLTIDATTNASAALTGTSTISIAGGATLKLLNSAATGNTNMLNDNAVLYLSDAVGNPTVELDLGAVTNAETVFGLLLDGVAQPVGDYSSLGVPAGSTVPASDFTGSGELFVSTAAPEPGSLGLFAIGVGGLTLMRRRRNTALAARAEGGK